MSVADERYLKLISKHFPTISAVSTEIINLKAILNLPKGTEHFLTDIHGEAEAFDHVIRNASGVIKRKINDAFKDTISPEEKKILATVVYYPKEKLSYVKTLEADLDEWYEKIIYQLVVLFRAAGYKYTRSKVRKAIPEHFRYIIEELFHEREENKMKSAYYQSIIDSIIKVGRADNFIVTIAEVIRRLVIDHLHIVGDIYDRGQGAHLIMDTLINHHSLDIQWGNHDILWMGAASGSMACMANVIRISLRYDTLGTLENAYGINLSPLVRFTLEKYKDEQISPFTAKAQRKTVKEKDIHLMSRMQKAIAVIQFKLEGQIIQRRPDFKMDNRLLLSQMDLEKGTVIIDSKEYLLKDTSFPTIDLENPYALTADEEDVMDKLKDAFVHSEKLQSHVRFLNKKGSMYKVFNKNLLYHACIPMTSDGSFKGFVIDGKTYKGKELLDYFDDAVNTAYYSKDKKAKEKALDLMWYLWCGETSPLYGKKKMATFERYFIEDSSIHKEKKNAYYNLRHEEKTCNQILEAFGLTDDHCHIVNGHVPVQVKKGESPIKGGGKLIAIDGGFSKAYQGVTGIAGYTLIYNSQGMVLVSHEAFNSKDNAIEKDLDMLPTTEFVQVDRPQMFVADTDIGKKIQSEIEVLNKLLEAYQNKSIKQQ